MNTYMSIHQVVDISSSQYVQSESGTSVMKLRIIDEEGHRVILTMFGLHGVGDFMTISEQD